MELAQEECRRSTNPNLPDDIFLEILYKLPIKSILRFRSVSKYHKSLISDPSFIHMHLQRRQPQSNNLFLHISSNPEHLQAPRFSLLKLDGASRPTECPFRPESHMYTVKATCAGLVLLSNSEYSHTTFMLWNPSTRKETKFGFVYKSSFVWYNYGLCHDRGDFKVVLASFHFFAVYSFNHNSWTKKNKLPHQKYHMGSNKAGTFVDGAIYWAVTLDSRHPNRSDEIFFFDMRDDEFKKLEKPGFCGKDAAAFNLVALRGCLCLYEHTTEREAVRIWIKEKGVDRNGWDELVTIENVKEPREWFIRVVCSLDDDDDKVLLQFRDYFVVYSIREKKRFPEFYLSHLSRVDLVPYRESMLFPRHNLTRKPSQRPLKLKIY